MLKQMKLMVDVDVYLKRLSSVMLENAPISMKNEKQGDYFKEKMLRSLNLASIFPNSKYIKRTEFLQREW